MIWGWGQLIWGKTRWCENKANNVRDMGAARSLNLLLLLLSWKT